MMNAALHPKPWYREFWPWFLMSLPATAVIAGVATVVIAIQSADGMVVGDYYKAGLAINQTLARDDAAYTMGLTATINSKDGMLLLNLGGRLPRYPDQLSLTLAHPTRSGLDQVLTLVHAGGSHYRVALPAMPAGKWQLHLADAPSTWRLSGIVHTPLNQPVTLSASTVLPPQGD
ncbi:MAG: FixH family protein [Gammaproteobacteria bacterium]|nr:FixH family protein [Gammaproteobacteria bacterium]